MCCVPSVQGTLLGVASQQCLYQLCSSPLQDIWSTYQMQGVTVELLASITVKTQAPVHCIIVTRNSQYLSRLQGVTVVSHASSAGGRLHAGATRKQLGDGEAKQRRVAYGSDVIKDELRKGAGGPAGAGPEQIGDSSEDEDEDTVPAARRDSITRYAFYHLHALSLNAVRAGNYLCMWTKAVI